MKLQIGETLKYLRREKGITQEELAEILGVSCQSVSRWELGVCYPDIELLPEISDFFSITVDKPIGTDSAIEKKKVDDYLNRYQEAVSHGDIERCIQIAAGHAAAFDNRPVEGNAYSLLLGQITWKQTDFETDDTRNCQEIMQNKWLAHPDFDPIRNTAAFQQIAQTTAL